MSEIPRGRWTRCAQFFEMVMTNSNFYGLREPLLGDLAASEVGLVRHLLGVDQRDVESYLNPLRDIEPGMQTLNKMIGSGYRVMILGKDVELLMRRILYPDIYWSEDVSGGYSSSARSPSIWTVAIPADPRGAAHLIKTQDLSATPMVNRHSMRMEIFDHNVMIQIKRIPEVRSTSRRSARCSQRMFQPGFSGLQSRVMCTVSGLDVSIDWDELYPASALSREHHIHLPYIDINHDPLVIAYPVDVAGQDPFAHLEDDRQALTLWQKGFPDRDSVRIAFKFGVNIPVVPRS